MSRKKTEKDRLDEFKASVRQLRKQTSDAARRRQQLRDAERRERQLGAREGVSLDAKIKAGEAKSASLGDFLATVRANQDASAAAADLQALMVHLQPRQRIILQDWLEGYNPLQISRRHGIPWTTVKRNISVCIPYRIRLGLGLETPPDYGARTRLPAEERRRRRAARRLRRYNEHRAQGLCRCGRERLPGGRHCQQCRNRRESHRQRRLDAGLCRECGLPRNGFSKLTCQPCAEVRREKETIARGTKDGQRHLRDGRPKRYVMVCVPDEMFMAVAQCAAGSEMTISNLTRQALDAYLEEVAA